MTTVFTDSGLGLDGYMAPFHTPVYVHTQAKREPSVRPGGTTFYFINDEPERAFELDRESAA